MASAFFTGEKALPAKKGRALSCRQEGQMQEGRAYGAGFAEAYDIVMKDIPYRDWADYVQGLLEGYGIRGGLVLELGCGTGNMTQLLAARGYDMIGVDNSEDMLWIAAKKREESGADILYLHQDMREFELYGTVGAVVCVCDSMNYITEYGELVQVFGLVNNYLDPGGIFVFDLKTEYMYRELMGSRTIAESGEDCSFIWENQYDEGTGINEYDLTVFVKEEGSGDLYRGYMETHFQRAYSVEEVKKALLEAGMEFEAAYGAFTTQAPREDSERIYVVARERGK